LGYLLYNTVVLSASGYRYPEDYCPPSAGCHELPIAVLPDHVHPRITAQDSQFTVHGRGTSSIEALCPEGIVKIILRGQVPEPKKTEYRKQTATYFPDKSGWAATECERFALKPYPERRIFNLLVRIWEQNLDILKGISNETPMPGVAGSRVDDSYIPRKEERRLTEWIGDELSGFIFVTGGAACGKTNFMIRAVLSGDRFKSHPPFISR
jgi:hypothetical protein